MGNVNLLSLQAGRNPFGRRDRPGREAGLELEWAPPTLESTGRESGKSEAARTLGKPGDAVMGLCHFSALYSVLVETGP